RALLQPALWQSRDTPINSSSRNRAVLGSNVRTLARGRRSPRVPVLVPARERLPNVAMALLQAARVAAAPLIPRPQARRLLAFPLRRHRGLASDIIPASGGARWMSAGEVTERDPAATTSVTSLRGHARTN